MPIYTVHHQSFGGSQEAVLAGVTVPNNRDAEIELTSEQADAFRLAKSITKLELVAHAAKKEGK